MPDSSTTYDGSFAEWRRLIKPHADKNAESPALRNRNPAALMAEDAV